MERSGRNHLLLYVSKTNKTVVDFQRRKTATKINIMGDEVETVDSCRYLDVNLNHRLDWRTNSDAVNKKGLTRLYLLKKLRSFNVSSKMLVIFY